MSNAFHLYFNLKVCGPLSDEMVQRASRYDWGWLVADADGIPDYTEHAALAAEFRARNPQHRTGWYCGGIASVRSGDPLYHRVDDGDLLHAPAGDGRPLHGVTPVTGLPTKLLDLSSPSIQEKVIALYTDFLEAHGWRGLLLDSFSPAFYAEVVAGAGGYSMSSGCLEGPAHTVAWWQDALGAFGERLRWCLGQRGHQTMVVGVAPLPYDASKPADRWMGPGNVNACDYASGVMFEHVQGIYGNPTYFADALTTIKAVTDKRRNIFVSVSPRLDVDAQNVPRQAEGLDLQRFYRAFYLLVQDAPYTTFGYHPYWPYRGWDDDLKPYVFWSEDWEHDIGMPLGPYAAQTGPLGTVWSRAYSRAVVVCNPGPGYRQIAMPGRFRLWDPVAGTAIDMAGAAPGYLLNVPPGQGWVLFREAS